MDEIFDGQIRFPEPSKTRYELEDILEIAAFNFGFEYSKYTTKKDEYKNYKNASQEIRRSLANDKIQEKKNGTCYYTKFAVEKAFRERLYMYFAKKVEQKDTYLQKINSTQESLDKKYESGHLYLPNASEESMLLTHIKLGIVFDFLTKHYIDVDEDMINADIGSFLGLAGEPYQILDDVNKIIVDRITGNFSDYYIEKAKKQEKEKQKKEREKQKKEKQKEEAQTKEASKEDKNPNEQSPVANKPSTVV